MDLSSLAFVGFYLNKEVSISHVLRYWCTDKPIFKMIGSMEDRSLWIADNDFKNAYFPRREFFSFDVREIGRNYYRY